MKRSEIKAGEWYVHRWSLALACPGDGEGFGYTDAIFHSIDGGIGGNKALSSNDDVQFCNPPPWFSARWESRDAMIAATTKILATLNFGDVDEAKSDLRNLLEQLKKGAENE